MPKGTLLCSSQNVQCISDVLLLDLLFVISMYKKIAGAWVLPCLLMVRVGLCQNLKLYPVAVFHHAKDTTQCAFGGHA